MGEDGIGLSGRSVVSQTKNFSEDGYNWGTNFRRWREGNDIYFCLKLSSQRPIFLYKPLV